MKNVLPGRILILAPKYHKTNQTGDQPIVACALIKLGSRTFTNPNGGIQVSAPNNEGISRLET